MSKARSALLQTPPRAHVPEEATNPTAAAPARSRALPASTGNIMGCRTNATSARVVSTAAWKDRRSARKWIRVFRYSSIAPGSIRAVSAPTGMAATASRVTRVATPMCRIRPTASQRAEGHTLTTATKVGSGHALRGSLRAQRNRPNARSAMQAHSVAATPSNVLTPGRGFMSIKRA